MQWSTSYFFPAIAMASHKGVASLMYVTDAKDKAVFYWWKTESFCNQHRAQPHRPHPARLRGKTFSGEYLMQNGLEIPYSHNADWGKANEWASRVLMLETAE